MNAKKESKINCKKNAICSLPVIQRSPNSKQTNKTTVANNVGKGENAISKMDGSSPLTPTNKPSPTKTSRNQVNANWNSVAGTFKSQRTIPSNKKNGKLPI